MRPIRVRATRRAGLLSLVLCACGFGGFTYDDEGGETGGNTPGRTLLLTTTDFATGALVSVDTQTLEVRERAVASSDAIPFVVGDLVYVVNRFGFDYVDVYDPQDGWRRVNQIPIALEGVPSTNPHAVAATPTGETYLSLYGASLLLRIDPLLPGADAIVDSVDLSAFADADGIAESSLLIPYASGVAVVIQRLDRTAGFAPVDDELLVFVDEISRSVIDVDPALAGDQGLVLEGQWPRQWRRDPTDPEVVYLLSTGLLRVDLSAHTQSWAIDEARFDNAGIGTRLQPQSFAIDATGQQAFIAAYDETFTSVSLYRAPLDGSGPLEKVVPGLNSVERTLEIIDDELWFATTSIGDEGVSRFSLDGVHQLGPLDSGLSPYSMTTY